MIIEFKNHLKCLNNIYDLLILPPTDFSILFIHIKENLVSLINFKHILIILDSYLNNLNYTTSL